MTYFNKCQKGDTIFKNKQTCDKSLTFSVNFNDVRAKWEQLTQIIQTKINVTWVTHVSSFISQVIIVSKTTPTGNKPLTFAVNSNVVIDREHDGKMLIELC